MGRNKLDKRSFWGGKIIGRLLLIVIVVDLQQLNLRRKLVMYIGIFVEIYHWQKRELVYETHEMIELEKYSISKAENPLNLES